MPKRIDNNIRVDTENKVTQFVLQRHIDGRPGLPATDSSLTAVSIAATGKLTGIGYYRLGLIMPHIDRLVARYGLEAPEHKRRGRPPKAY